MSVTTYTRPGRRGRPPTAARFRRVFDRDPTDDELSLFEAAHQALMLGLPAKARRRAGTLITRL